MSINNRMLPFYAPCTYMYALTVTYSHCVFPLVIDFELWQCFVKFVDIDGNKGLDAI